MRRIALALLLALAGSAARAADYAGPLFHASSL